MNNQFSKLELKKISLDFRTVSSRFLRSNMDDVDSNLKRFLSHILETTLINDYVNSCNILTYSIEEDVKGQGYNQLLSIPTQPKEEVSYVFQLMTYLKDIEHGILNLCHGYGRGSKMQDHVDGFLRRVIQPFVNNINNFMEHLIIDFGENEKSNVKIEVNNSQGVAISNNGSTTNFKGEFNSNNVKSVGEEIINALPNESDLSDKEKDEIKDYIEYFLSETKRDKPNIRFVSRMLNQFKKIPNAINFTIQTSEKIQEFIQMIQAIV